MKNQQTKKMKKTVLGILGDFCASEEDFLGGFWIDFAQILDRFLTDFEIFCLA